MPNIFAAKERSAAKAVQGRVPLFVGVMDNGIERVLERIRALNGLAINGVVLTAPYYFMLSEDSLMRYFTAVADASSYPLYLYDLPVSVKHKLSCGLVEKLAQHPNIMGIKTADLPMVLKLSCDGRVKDTFAALYSGLETVDVGYAHGVRRYLDGMFAVAPRNAQAMDRCLRAGDFKKASAHLNTIVHLRDVMAGYGIFPSFTVMMNLLGIPGEFAPSYEAPVDENGVAVLKKAMRDAGELD